jgi:hypothetical protein
MNAPTTVLLLSLLGAPPAASTDPLCAGRPPCRVMETLDAGQNEQGQPLQVKRLSLGWTDLESGARFEGRKFGPGGRKAEGAAKEGRCEATEWWLLRPAKPAQLLLSVCDDYQGAVREEEMAVGHNRLRHERSGVRRDERWSTSRALNLSPLRLSSDIEGLQWNSPMGEEKEEGTSWDYDTLRGKVFRAPAECPPGQASLGARVLPYLPQVQVDASYLEGGWKQAVFGVGEGACFLPALHYVLGKEGTKASLKALLVSEDTLIVEVRDDKWTGPSDKWLHDDHVEVWLSPLPPQELNGCGGKLTQEQKPVQWGIRMVDGKVFPAHGAPKQMLQVERAEMPDKQGYRMKVKLPTPFLGISVIYSDSDSGTKQEAMVATSPLKFGRPETFNPVRMVLPSEATCGVRDGKLFIIPGPEIPTEPDRAVLQDRNL